MAEMQSAGSFAIPPDHPSLDGHFPGNPVVPGVVLLDTAFAAIRAAAGLGVPLHLGAVKFTAPVLPGQCIAVLYDVRAPPGRIGFVCRVGAETVAAGEANFATGAA